MGSRTGGNKMITTAGTITGTEAISMIPTEINTEIPKHVMEELHSIQSDVHAEVVAAQRINMKDYEVIENLKFGFFVEVCEVANELEFFKHWKKHKKKGRMRVLEELADCFAFLMALCDVKGYQRLVTNPEAFPFYDDSDYIEMFILLKRLDLESFVDVQTGMQLIMGVALKAGFTIDELVDAYKEKSNVNIDRQKEKY